jgi:hypothetical protein
MRFMFTHVWPMFIHVETNSELWIKGELRFNYELI